MALLSVAIVYWWGEGVPDWAAYRLIFDSGGWLFTQQRDVGFLALIAVFKGLVSADYEVFRICVASCFILASGLLVWFLKRRDRSSSDLYFLSYIGILPVAIPRFTVQIREGVAVSLVLLGLGLLWRPERSRLSGWVFGSLSLLALGVAVTIHVGSAVFLTTVGVALLLFLVTSILRVPSKVALVLAIVLTAASFVALIGTGAVNSFLRDFSTQWYGIPSPEAVQVSSLKFLYWTITAIIVWYVAVKIKVVAGVIGQNSVYGIYLRYTGYAVLPALQGFIFLLLIGGYPGVVVSSAIRIYESVLFTTLALVSFSIRKTWLFVAIVLFLLVNEQRVLLAAAGR